MNSRTIRAIEFVFGVCFSDAILNAANSEFHAGKHRFHRQREFTFSSRAMCFQTTVCLCEQLFRRCEYLHVLGELLDGTFGDMLTSMMISSANKKKYRNAHTTGGDDNRTSMDEYRTSYERPVRLHNYADLIKETAVTMLFGAVPELQILTPIEMGNLSAVGSIRWKIEKDGKPLRDDFGNRLNIKQDVHTTWKDYYCMDASCGNMVRFASMFSNKELEILGEIIAYNVNCSRTNNWNAMQFCTINSVHSPNVCNLFGDKNIRVVRRVKSTFSRAISNCIIAAFSSATRRVVKLEFGHTTELSDIITETRAERANRYTDPMLPIMWADAIGVRATPLQKVILSANMETETNEECFWLVNARLAKPISQATFYKNLRVLKDIAKEVSIND